MTTPVLLPASGANLVSLPERLNPPLRGSLCGPDRCHNALLVFDPENHRPDTQSVPSALDIMMCTNHPNRD